MEKIGKPVPKSKAGVTAVTKALAEYLGVDMNDTIAGAESKMRAKLKDMLATHESPAAAQAEPQANGGKLMGERIIAKDWTELTEQENPPLDRDLTDYSRWRRNIAARLLPDGTSIQREAVQMELSNAISEETAKKNPDGKPKYDQWQTHIIGQRIAGELLTGKRQEIIRKARERALNDEYSQWDMAMEWLEDKPAPLSIEAHKKYSRGSPLPKGFVKEGDFYVFKPAPSPATPQAEGGIFGYSWADIRSKQQGGTLAALIRGKAVKPKATESDFAVLEKHGMDWLYDNEKVGIIDRLGLPAERPSKKTVEVKQVDTTTGGQVAYARFSPDDILIMHSPHETQFEAPIGSFKSKPMCVA